MEFRCHPTCRVCARVGSPPAPPPEARFHCAWCRETLLRHNGVPLSPRTQCADCGVHVFRGYNGHGKHCRRWCNQAKTVRYCVSCFERHRLTVEHQKLAYWRYEFPVAMGLKRK